MPDGFPLFVRFPIEASVKQIDAVQELLTVGPPLRMESVDMRVRLSEAVPVMLSDRVRRRSRYVGVGRKWPIREPHLEHHTCVVDEATKDRKRHSNGKHERGIAAVSDLWVHE